MTIRSFQGVSPTVPASAHVDEQAVVIGRVTLGEQTNIWPCAVVRGDVNDIRIGDRTNIQDGAVLHVAHEGEHGKGYALVIGRDVTVGHNATVHACTIEDEVLIGMNATILDGALVPKHCIVGANALVPPGKQLQSGWMYMGIPAKPVRELTEQEIAFFRYSAQHYVKLMQAYQAEESGT